MLAFGTDLINGAALWKIILVSMVCGAGAAIAFGLLLFGLTRSRSSQTGERVLGYSLATLCGAFCIAAVVFGIVAMVHK